jgi:hypothetical protein
MVSGEASMALDPLMEFDRSTFALFSRALDRAIDSLPAEIAQDNPTALLKQILKTRVASQIVPGECDEQRSRSHSEVRIRLSRKASATAPDVASTLPGAMRLQWLPGTWRTDTRAQNWPQPRSSGISSLSHS